MDFNVNVEYLRFSNTATDHDCKYKQQKPLLGIYFLVYISPPEYEIRGAEGSCGVSTVCKLLM